jgi:hypothetical protein
MPVIVDSVTVGAGSYNGASVYAWKASRFSVTPAENAAPPGGSADAGPVTSGSSFGAEGAFQITVPTFEQYYCQVVIGATTGWKGPVMPASGGASAPVDAFGADPTGTLDSSTAISNAIASLPAYSGGGGGGIVLFGPGTYKIGGGTSLTSALTSGVMLQGAGEVSTKLIGTIAGPMLGTPTDGTANPLTNFLTIRGLQVINQSTNAAASTVSLQQISSLLVERARFVASATGSGSKIVYGAALYVATFRDSWFGGATGSDVAFAMDGTKACNVVNFDACTFSDAKAGLQAINGTSLRIGANCHFSALAGGAVGANLTACINIDAWNTVVIEAGSYFESNHCQSVRDYGANGPVTNVTFGACYHINCSTTSFVALSYMSGGYISRQSLTPGALATNPNGLDMRGASNFIVEAQALASGSGTPLLTDAPMNNGVITGSGGVTLSSGVKVQEGSNAKQGRTAALAGTPGTLVVANTSVTANSRVMLTRAAPAGTLGHISVSVIASTSFTILSTANETSTFNFEIFEPG